MFVFNRQHHIRNILKFGLPVVVCHYYTFPNFLSPSSFSIPFSCSCSSSCCLQVSINHFSTDTQPELDLVRKAALDPVAFDAHVARHWELGGAGIVDVARSVQRACALKAPFQFLYPLTLTIQEKIEAICKQIYGDDGVAFQPQAQTKLALYTRAGYGNLPICIFQDPSFTQ